MLPMKAPKSLRVVGAFDLIAPDGQIHRFPRLTWLQRACMRLHALAEPAILSAVILGLIYTAGVLGREYGSTPHPIRARSVSCSGVGSSSPEGWCHRGALLLLPPLPATK